MPARESVKEKAGRFLLAGHLRIHEISEDRITATIHGDTGTYRLGWHPRVPGGWYCLCPARTACAHLIALRSVTGTPQPAT